MDNQTWSLWGATQVLADAEVATCTGNATTSRDVLANGNALLLVFSVAHCLLTRLSDLAADLLTLVADALTLVRIVLTQAADHCCDLSNLLLVDARN